MFRKFFNIGEEQPSKGHDTIVLFGLDQCWRNLICISVHLAMSNVGSCFCSRGVSGMHIIFCKRHCHHEVMKHSTVPFLSPLPTPLPNVLLCRASGIALCSLVATVSVRHLPPSYVWNMTAIIVLVPLPLLSSFLRIMQKQKHATIMLLSQKIRGCVNATAPDGVRHPPNALMFLPPDSPFALAWHVLLTSFPRWHKILSFKHTQNFFLSKSDFINVTRSLVIESI